MLTPAEKLNAIRSTRVSAGIDPSLFLAIIIFAARLAYIGASRHLSSTFPPDSKFLQVTRPGYFVGGGRS